MSNILMQRLTWRSTTLIGFESVLIAGAIAAGVYLRLAGATPAAGLIPRMLLVIVICQLCLYYRNLYEFRVLANRSELLIRVLQALGAASVILALRLPVRAEPDHRAAACSSRPGSSSWSA